MHRLTLLQDGFRPFFLAAAILAAVAVPLWMLTFAGLFAFGVGPEWHAHEMLFGYVEAVLCGFLLTALPNWTGRAPLRGGPLAALVALWLAGRLAVFGSAVAGGTVGLLGSVFPFAVAAFAWREVLLSGNRRNLPVCLLATLLAVADAWHASAWLSGGESDMALRAGIAVVIMLISLIGGRIVPNFSRNWLTTRAAGPMPAAPGRYDAAVLAVTAAALLGWVVRPEDPAVGAGLLAAGALQAGRVLRWRGERTVAAPLLLVLHVGYAWIPVGLVLLGLAALGVGPVTASSGVHALTAGAIGLMTVAVMTRASLGHSGRPLTAGPATTAIYVLVMAGAAARVLASLAPYLFLPLLGVGAALWSGGFALFLLAYGPLLLTLRRGPS